MSFFLNTGNSINIVEPLRDFNGFSWNIIEKDIENIDYNLIYQNMNYLLGNKFLDKWINNYEPLVDYFGLFQEKIQERYDKKNSEKILSCIIKLAIMLKAEVDGNFKKEIINKTKDVEQEYYEYENKEMFLIKISKSKKKREKEIKKIDNILNNENLLKEEYEKRNEKLPLERKIFSARVFKQVLKEERKELLDQIYEFNQMMNPKIFLERKDILAQKLKYLNIYKDTNLQEEIQKQMIILQKEIINCMKIDVKKSENKNSLIEMIYKFRYYYYLPVKNKKNIGDVEELKDDLDDLAKILIEKATDQKVLAKILQDEDKNYNLVKEIILLKIISLEDINLKIIQEKQELILKVFDEEIEDTIKRLENIKKEDVKIRLNKKTKLFV